MLEETGEKIFSLSQDTGKQSGNISTPERASVKRGKGLFYMSQRYYKLDVLYSQQIRVMHWIS